MTVWTNPYAVIPLVGIAVVAVAFLLRPVAWKVGLVDRPGGRKQHRQPTPLLGGSATFLVFLVVAPLAGVPRHEWLALVLAGGVVFAAGLVDDIREISPGKRFLAQGVAALLIWFVGGVGLTSLGNLTGSGDIQLGVLALPFTVFCTLGVINATNMTDGLDGLAGGTLLIVFGIFYSLAVEKGYTEEARLLLLLCGVLAGFLLLNFRFHDALPARIFMGDAGTLFFGLVAAWYLMRFTQAPYHIIRPITAVWVFALPLMDTVTIMTRRVIAGRSPFEPDREHLHHLLRRLGFDVSSTVFFLLGTILLLASIGFVGEKYDVPEWVMFYGFLALFALYFVAMHLAWKRLNADQAQLPNARRPVHYESS